MHSSYMWFVFHSDADLSTLEFYEVIATKDSQSNTGFKIQIYRRTPGVRANYFNLSFRLIFVFFQNYNLCLYYFYSERKD